MTKYPELSMAAYNKNPAALNEPDGMVAIWNLHLLERPEFTFHAQVKGYNYIIQKLHLFTLVTVLVSLMFYL